jgi:hypothetical protein
MSLNVARGTCYVLFAYDIGQSIHLEEAEHHILSEKQREGIRHKRRAPKYFEFHPAPLRVLWPAEPVEFGNFQTLSEANLVLYDFGAVLVIYQIPISGPFEGLLALSNDLSDSSLLLEDSRKQVELIADIMAGAVVKRRIHHTVEDYLILQIEAFTDSCLPDQFLSRYGQQIAQILRAEQQVLSPEEVSDSLSQKISFGLNDVTIVDWNAALMVDCEGDDIRSILEFANAELLEMRYLDGRLVDDLDRAYEALSRQRDKLKYFRGSFVSDMERIAQMQVDSAMLFEGVNNALKLLGDQYLARVYRLVSLRFHLAEWDAGILRKIETLESIYQKMSLHASTRRMEMLEWVIIILIALSIMLPFLLEGTALS